MKGVDMVGGVNYEDIAPEALEAAGTPCHIIGGAIVASVLDAKRTINQGTRLAAAL